MEITVPSVVDPARLTTQVPCRPFAPSTSAGQPGRGAGPRRTSSGRSPTAGSLLGSPHGYGTWGDRASGPGSRQVCWPSPCSSCSSSPSRGGDTAAQRRPPHPRPLLSLRRSSQCPTGRSRPRLRPDQQASVLRRRDQRSCRRLRRQVRPRRPLPRHARAQSPAPWRERREHIAANMTRPRARRGRCPALRVTSSSRDGVHQPSRYGDMSMPGYRRLTSSSVCSFQ